MALICLTPKKKRGGKGRDAQPPPSRKDGQEDFHFPQLEKQGSLPIVRVWDGGMKRPFLLDSGAENSLVRPGIQGGNVEPSTSVTIGVSWKIVRWQGKNELCFTLNVYVYEHSFGILPLPPKFDGILGVDFLEKMQASINLGKAEIRLKKGRELPRYPYDQGPSRYGGRKRRRPRRGEANLDSPLDQQRGCRTINLSRKWSTRQNNSQGRGRSWREANDRRRKAYGLQNHAASEIGVTAVHGNVSAQLLAGAGYFPLPLSQKALRVMNTPSQYQDCGGASAENSNATRV
jgi:hypothetical protein